MTTQRQYKRGETRADGYRYRCLEGGVPRWLSPEAYERMLQQNRETRKRARLKNKAWLQAYKLERGCADCGYNGHFAALEFDHRPGEEKLLNIGKSHTRARATLEREVVKCDVVCANCHAIRSFTRLGQLEHAPGLYGRDEEASNDTCNRSQHPRRG